jgi:hypothetical protein
MTLRGLQFLVTSGSKEKSDPDVAAAPQNSTGELLRQRFHAKHRTSPVFSPRLPCVLVFERASMVVREQALDDHRDRSVARLGSLTPQQKPMGYSRQRSGATCWLHEILCHITMLGEGETR